MIVENNTAYLMAMGDGSRIEIHAADREKEGWTQLESTAAVGANEITVQESTGWEVGDKIAIASTSSDWQEAEEFTILAISDDGKTITLDGDLQFDHRGETVSYDNGQTGELYREWDVEIRAEVALLSRNVTIQGDEDSVDDGLGGHVMAMDGAELYLEGTEFFRMGQESILGRYPVHWHMLADATGQYAINNSIHDSYQKGTTIHGTSNLLLEDNVIYDHVGHGVFLEDGSENGNHIYGNLVFSTRENADGEPIPTDGANASSFWIENANNYFIGNHAAGSESNGFWIIETAPHGLSETTFVGERGSLSDLIFISNTGHTNSGDNGAGGTDKTLGIDGTVRDDLSLRQLTLDGDFAVIQDFTAYEGNVWLLTTEVVVSDSMLVDSRGFIRHENYVEDTLFAKEDLGGAHVAIYRDGGQQLNNVHLADGYRLNLLNTDHQNGADVLNNVTFEGTSAASIMRWLSSNAVYQKTVIDIDGTFTGVPGTTLIPDTEVGAFKAPPGSVYSDDFNSWLTQHTVGATEVTLLDGEGDVVALSGAFRILRSDGESSDDHPTSKDNRRNGDFNNDHNDRSDASYEFNTATGMEQDVAYLLDTDLGDLSPTNPLELTLNLVHVMEGQSAVYEIPGIAGSYAVTDGGTRVFSFDELLAADESAYYRDDDSGSVFVRLIADDVEVYLDRPVDDLAADFRASTSLTMTITGQDALDHGNLSLTSDLLTAIDNQAPLQVSQAPQVVEAEDPNLYYIAYDQKLTEAQTTSTVPDTAAQGSFDVNYNVDTREVAIFGEFENLASDITMMHLHFGAEGSTGGVIFGLTVTSDDGRSGSFEGTATLSAAQAEALLDGDTYVNLHTADNPSGALRGQVDMQQAGDFFIDRPDSTSDTTDINADMARWSDAATWDDGVPGPGDTVVIGAGKTVVLDVDATVGTIIVNGGELIVEDVRDLELVADQILVINGGLFQVGTEDTPHVHDFTLTLEGDDATFDLDVMAAMNDPDTVMAMADAPDNTVIQIGKTVVDQESPGQWIRIDFDQTIEDAVVILGAPSGTGAQPIVARTRNVDDTGFELQIDEWEYLDGTHHPVRVAWMAGSEGDYTMEGGGRVVIGETSGTEGSVDLDGFIESPLIIGQTGGTVDTAQTHRISNVDGNGFDWQMQTEEAGGNAGNEDFAYAAFEANAFGFDMGVAEVSDEWTVVDEGYTKGIFADMQTMNGTDTAAMRHREIDGNVELRVQEERSLDLELTHIAEDVAWLAMDLGTYDLS